MKFDEPKHNTLCRLPRTLYSSVEHAAIIRRFTCRVSATSLSPRVMVNDPVFLTRCQRYSASLSVLPAFGDESLLHGDNRKFSIGVRIKTR